MPDYGLKYEWQAAFDILMDVKRRHAFTWPVISATRRLDFRNTGFPTTSL